mgnify:CR=1 FL=1
MLDSHFLLIVLPGKVRIKDGGTGHAVRNFRATSVPLNALSAVNDHLRTVIEPHLTLAAEDMLIADDEFSSLFAKYRPEETG